MLHSGTHPFQTRPQFNCAIVGLKHKQYGSPQLLWLCVPRLRHLGTNGDLHSPSLWEGCMEEPQRQLLRSRMLGPRCREDCQNAALLVLCSLLLMAQRAESDSAKKRCTLQKRTCKVAMLGHPRSRAIDSPMCGQLSFLSQHVAASDWNLNSASPAPTPVKKANKVACFSTQNANTQQSNQLVSAGPRRRLVGNTQYVWA